MKGLRGNALVAAALLAATPVRGDDASAPMDVTASCEHRTAKGRVLCDVELEVALGSIAWADVVVLAAPPFAAPLRSRVGAAEARARTERRVRIPVALVATGLGRGPVTVRGRAVVCTATDHGEVCSPRTATAEAELLVGTDVQP